jgi:phosphoesterase RecJ-like protein
MLGGLEDEYYSKYPEDNRIDIVIDHHVSNTGYGKYNYVNADAAASGEIIYALAVKLGVPLTPELALPLYCAISDDTGGFRYPNTTPNTMRIAASLMDTGIDFARLCRLMYHTKNAEQLAAERMAYNALKLYCGDKAAFISISNELKKTYGLEKSELEGISNLPKDVAGAEVGVVMKEISADPEGRPRFKISLRSNEYINVSDIAARFGGGGHFHAAGCRITGSEDEAIAALTDAIDEVLAEYEKRQV